MQMFPSYSFLISVVLVLRQDHRGGLWSAVEDALAAVLPGQRAGRGEIMKDVVLQHG